MSEGGGVPVKWDCPASRNTAVVHVTTLDPPPDCPMCGERFWIDMSDS